MTVDPKQPGFCNGQRFMANIASGRSYNCLTRKRGKLETYCAYSKEILLNII